MIWWVLSITAGVALWVHRSGPNAVWGTASFGIIIGFVIAVVQPGFEWTLIGKAIVIGTLAGLMFQWLPRITNRLAK